MTRRLLLAVLASGLLAGCGSGGGSDSATTTTRTPPATTRPLTTPADPQEQQDSQLPEELRLPKSVPSQASGTADAASQAVIRRWALRLRTGDVAGAASTFAQPSKVQNGTPVITLVNREQRLAFNASFPCGAVPTRFGGAPDGYVIVAFRLVERTGGDCAGAAGNSARCAIRVRDGRITDWYRLAQGSATPPAPSASEADPGTDIA